MIDKTFLDEWMEILVPPEYLPDKDPKADTPLLGIYVVESDIMSFSKKLWAEEASEESILFGQLIDMGSLLDVVSSKRKNKPVKPRKKGLTGKYIIRINENQSENSAIFSLAHEIGHLFGSLQEPEKHDEDPDGYADVYAYALIKKKIRDSSKRYAIYREAFMFHRV